MAAVFLALLASFAFACTATLVHRGVRELDPFSGLLVDLLVNGALLWLFVFTYHDLSELWAGANLIFAVSGLLVPGFFRLMAFKGIERLGASAATAVLNSAPLFAVLLAMMLLDEQPGPANLLGAMAVVGGLIFLSWKGESRSWRARDLVYPVSGALLAALRDNMVRFGLLGGPAPMVGATITVSASFLAMSAAYFPRNGLTRIRVCGWGTIGCFGLVGFVHSVAYYLMFSAFDIADVAVVSPLVHCFSLFTLGLAPLILGESDPITRRKVMATSMVVLGVLLIAWSRWSDVGSY